MFGNGGVMGGAAPKKQLATSAPECTGKSRATCTGDCVYQRNSCVLSGDADAPSPPASASASASSKTPVIYHCTVDGAPVEGTTWVDSTKAMTGTASSEVEALARKTAGAASSAPVTCDIAVQSTLSGTEWMNHKMAANCAPHFDLNRITSMNHFSCIYEGAGTVNGKRVRRPGYEIKGQLASCDHHEYAAISDEVMKSIQLYAWKQAGGREAELDADKFVCSVQSLPQF